MTLTEARHIWAGAQADLAPVEVEGRSAEVLREDLAGLEQARFERPLIRLLPYFDSFLLGHKERDHLVDPEHRAKVYRPQGWIAPVVLINGRVAGVWEHAREGNRLRVKVTTLGPASRRFADGIGQEARDLGRFVGISETDVEVI